MPRFSTRRATAAAALALSLGACDSTGPDQPGVWGSNQVTLTVAANTTTLKLLASGDCYGSYGEIDQPIPQGNFVLTGTYTQLTGVFPGNIQYPAQYVGTVAGRRMTLTIGIPALQQTFGPFRLTYGMARTWPACLYP